MKDSGRTTSLELGSFNPRDACIAVSGYLYNIYQNPVQDVETEFSKVDLPFYAKFVELPKHYIF